MLTNDPIVRELIKEYKISPETLNRLEKGIPTSYSLIKAFGKVSEKTQMIPASQKISE